LTPDGPPHSRGPCRGEESKGREELVVNGAEAPGEKLPRVSYRGAFPTPRMNGLSSSPNINPLYALFLMEYFPMADETELLQILDASGAPGSARHVRVRPHSSPRAVAAIE